MKGLHKIPYLLILLFELDFVRVSEYLPMRYCLNETLSCSTKTAVVEFMKSDLQKLTQKNLNAAVSGLKAIAHPCRLQILCTLLDEEKSVGDIVKMLNLSQSAASQHLSRMKIAGVLDSRRNGNQVFYALKEGSFEELLSSLCKIYVK